MAMLYAGRSWLGVDFRKPSRMVRLNRVIVRVIRRVVLFILLPLLTTLGGVLRSRALLHLEILSLRQQLAMVNQSPRKRGAFSLARTALLDLALSPLAWLSRDTRHLQARHLGALAPQRLSLYWAWKSRRRRYEDAG